MDEARGGPLSVARLRVVAFDVAVDYDCLVRLGELFIVLAGRRCGLLTIAYFEANVVPVEGSWGRREHGGGVEWIGCWVESESGF